MKYTYRISGSIFILSASILLLLIAGCASSGARYGRDARQNTSGPPAGKPIHSIVLAGDAGDNPPPEVVSALSDRLRTAGSLSTLLFLGDNIYPDGMPELGTPGRIAAENKLEVQLSIAKVFSGKTIFIPGNHDWRSEGRLGLRRQQDLINKADPAKISMLPANGCGITTVDVGSEISLIVIDSQWYLQDWDKNPGINEDCNIKTKEAFYAALEEALNLNQRKTVLLAVHHPLISNGEHGGQFSVRKNIFPLESQVPLPALGTVANFLRKTSGVSLQDLQNKKYSELINRISTILADRRNVIVVSGHDHSLQYLQKDEIKQVISGSMSKKAAARAIQPNDFTYGGHGYAVVDVYKDSETWVTFFGIRDGKEMLLHKVRAISPKEELIVKTYPTKFKTQIKASVYNDSLLRKSGFHNFLWGKHFRSYYGVEVNAPSLVLENAYGGAKPLIAGEGELANSLMLEDKAGRQYVMRGLQKDAVGYIQSMAFKNQSVGRALKNSYAENFVLDFYTSSHPYAQFAVGKLAKAASVTQADPKLYYVPKQNALADFNQKFGDALYLVEEYPANGGEKGKSFGSPIAIVGTEIVLQQLRKDEKYEVDEDAYIRARLFDMLIGDWNRDQDHWRWGVHKEGDKIIYRPIPVGRDQAFTKYDGALLYIVLKNPNFRQMQTFGDDIKNIRWFNSRAYTLDMALLRTSTLADWKKQADALQTAISDTEIDAAFAGLPSEVRDEEMEKIRRNLKVRRGKLSEFATRYYNVLRHTAIVIGTDKANRFEITRLKNKETSVKVFTLSNTEERLLSEQLFSKKQTKNLWIYGNEGGDVFEVKGSARNPIKTRLFGGLDDDSYSVENGSNIRIHDLKEEQNTFDTDFRTRRILSRDYETNSYDFDRPKFNAFSGLPNIGFNPDDGIKLGAYLTYTVNGFKRNPYSQKHSLRANYYFATKGYELLYNGLFPEFITNWMLDVNAGYTSPNFSFNFFGYGNETINEEDDKGMDYNRVRAQIIRISPSLIRRGEHGGFLMFNTTLESVTVENTPNRLISEGLVSDDAFDTNNFAGLAVRYGFENYDVPSNPTLGLRAHVEAGYTVNIAVPSRNVPHAAAELGFSHKLSSNGKLVIASLASAKFIFSDEYEFYQMAAIGGDTDLRAYRSERFTGKQSYFQTSDLRLELGEFNNIVPLRYGVLGGFDYGRVWLPGEESLKWHTSYGGGIWLNGLNLLTAKLGWFHSSEGGRVSFGLGFGF